jgi:hypothetical protein
MNRLPLKLNGQMGGIVIYKSYNNNEFGLSGPHHGHSAFGNNITGEGFNNEISYQVALYFFVLSVTAINVKFIVVLDHIKRN